MARYRENDSITKTRNDQFLRRSGGLIQKTEKVNRDKSSKSPGRDKRGVAGDYVKAGGGIGKGAHYRYQPSPVIAFRSLVPMKTLILDLVRELLNAGKGEGRGGGGGGAVEASIYTARDPVLGAISNIADTIKGSWTGSEMFDFTAPPSSHRNMTSAMTDHLQQVLQDRPLLVVLFLELASSVQQLRVDVSVALSVTSLRPFKESYASSNLHCERGSCSMELFEAYVDCPKCGVICLQCASGCGDAHKGGCVEEERVSPETVPFLPQALYRDQCTASPDTVTTASESKMAPSLAETEFRPVTPASAAGHAHAEIAIPHPMRAEVTAVQDSACPDTASSPLATSPPPFPCLDEAKECHPISAPVAHVRVLHVHYPGARLLLKTPLTALSKTVKDFAALIIQLHPEEEERIRTLRVTSPVTSQV